MEVNTSITSIRIQMKHKVVKRIGWVNGQWGNIHELSIPLQDRGLNHADGIFETILIWEGKPQLLEAHIKRWEKGAALLGMAAPPQQQWIEQLIQEAVKRSYCNHKSEALRVNWSRGNEPNRGIDIIAEEPDPSTHRFWLELSPISPKFQAISTFISMKERRNASSQLNHCKTFGYGQSIQARREARLAGYDDALLKSTNGELSCGTTSNLIIKRNNEFLTPRLESGCLPGIMREKGLESGLFKEAEIDAKPQNHDEWLLINSLSCHPIIKVNQSPLNEYSEPAQLWRSLYQI